MITTRLGYKVHKKRLALLGFSQVMAKVHLHAVCLVLLSGLICPLTSSANWWDADFNAHSPRWSEDNGSGTWGKFWTHGSIPRHRWAVDVVGGNHPRRAGAQSIRFERRTGYCGGDDCDRGSERTELGTDGVDRPGDDSWYAWSIYHQNYRFMHGVAPQHGQFKTMGAAGHQYAFFNMDEHRGMVINFDAFEGWGGSKVLIPKSQINNRWHDIRVHAKWSTGSDGVFQIWVNGVLKVDRRGRNMIDADPVAFRFGIYAPQANRAGSGRPTQVVYYDELMRGNSCQSVSQFMSCPDGGDGNPSASGTGGSGDKNADFAKYVDMHGDLIAAYNQNSAGKSKADWGKWHYCSYGKNEGRAGLTPANCAGGLETNNPKIDTTVNGAGERGTDRFTSEITDGVRRFSRVAILNGNVFSFKDYQTVTAYEVKKNRGLMLGFSKNTDPDGTVRAPIGIGWLFDNVAIMAANDNSMLGYKAAGIFDFKDPDTTYLGLGFRQRFSDTLALYSDLIYAFGRSRPGELVTMSNVHALGFASTLHYLPAKKHKFSFSLDIPLRVESGSSQFIVSQLGKLHQLNIDLTPEGRQVDLGMSYTYALTQSSRFTAELHHSNDVDHRQGNDDARAVVKLSRTFQ